MTDLRLTATVLRGTAHVPQSPTVTVNGDGQVCSTENDKAEQELSE